MRIGTWNLDGRWTPAHLTFLQGLRCDVLLLTEVRHDAVVPEMRRHTTAGEITEGRFWAAVMAADLAPLPDPHGASAAARVGGLTFCSSVLPWKASGGDAPWDGHDTGERAVIAVAAIRESRPDVWGGDWNTSLEGRDWVGTKRGRIAITDACDELGLAVPTAAKTHRETQQGAIDHVAVPRNWRVVATEHVVPLVGGRYLADHDAYVVEVAPDVTSRLTGTLDG